MKVKERSKSSTGSKEKLVADLQKVLAANLKREAARALKGKKAKSKSTLTVSNHSWGAVYRGKPSEIVAAFKAKPESWPVNGRDGEPFSFQERAVRLASADKGRFWEAFVSYSHQDLDRSAQVREAEQAITKATEMLGAIFWAVRRIHPEALSAKLKIEAKSE